MKIYQDTQLEPKVFTTQVSTETRNLEIKVETFSDGTIRYSLYDLAYKQFGGLDYSAYAEPLDDCYPLYTQESSKPLGIARTESEAHDRLMLKIQRRIKRMRTNEGKSS